jgi:hypothetical protein
VYTYADNAWYLDEDVVGMISGEEYFTVYKKITEYYPHGWVPYPASTEFKIPLRSRAYLTVVNLDKKNNDVEIDFSRLILPYKTNMDPYKALTFDFSENSYYPMDMINPQTTTKEDPKWLYSDPYNRYVLDDIPRIAIHDDDPNEFTQEVEWENITKGSTVKIKSSSPILVFINYIKDQPRYPHGVDLIPGLTPPTMRGLPGPPTMIVLFSGMIIVADVIMITVGRRSIVELF